MTLPTPNTAKKLLPSLNTQTVQNVPQCPEIDLHIGINTAKTFVLPWCSFLGLVCGL